MIQVKLNRRVRGVAILLLALGLTACAETEEVYTEQPVELLYNAAKNELDTGNYKKASSSFDEVDRQHPYSVWATKSQLMSAYAYYLGNEYDDAIIGLDRFIQLHPSHQSVSYAHYLKALSYYEQISDVGRDQKMTELALKFLNEIVTRFPNSKYARDAKLKIDLTRDHLAGKEMEIGRYYLNQSLFLAAINRFKVVTSKFQTTTHVPEALHRLTEAYLSLGLSDQANKTAAILGYNFPGSEWYLDTFEIVEQKTVRPKVEKEAPWYWPFQ